MLIGICGMMGSGKDTVADYLCTRFDGRKISFAGKLKRIVADLFSITKEEERGREILQKVGAFMREIDENVWVNALSYDIGCLNIGGMNNIIVSDVRYPNEAQFILDMGGTVICLNIDESARMKRLKIRDGEEPDLKSMEHESEKLFAKVKKISGVKQVFITPYDDEEVVNMKVMRHVPTVIA